MKKLLVAALIIIAAGGVYALTRNDTETTQNTNQTNSNPSPAPVTPPHEEGMGEAVEPAPAPTPTPTPGPEPIKDDIDDVDVLPPQAKFFNLTGRNFVFSQTEIKVKKGDVIQINFESTDGLHDWVVDEFNARTERVNPGTKTSVEFIANKTGTFEYYCSVSIHRAAGMKGKLIVE